MAANPDNILQIGAVVDLSQILPGLEQIGETTESVTSRMAANLASVSAAGAAASPEIEQQVAKINELQIQQQALRAAIRESKQIIAEGAKSGEGVSPSITKNLGQEELQQARVTNQLTLAKAQLNLAIEKQIASENLAALAAAREVEFDEVLTQAAAAQAGAASAAQAKAAAESESAAATQADAQATTQDIAADNELQSAKVRLAAATEAQAIAQREVDTVPPRTLEETAAINALEAADVELLAAQKQVATLEAQIANAAGTGAEMQQSAATASERRAAAERELNSALAAQMEAEQSLGAAVGANFEQRQALAAADERVTTARNTLASVTREEQGAEESLVATTARATSASAELTATLEKLAAQYSMNGDNLQALVAFTMYEGTTAEATAAKLIQLGYAEAKVAAAIREVSDAAGIATPVVASMADAAVQVGATSFVASTAQQRFAIAAHENRVAQAALREVLKSLTGVITLTTEQENALSAAQARAAATADAFAEAQEAVGYAAKNSAAGMGIARVEMGALSGSAQMAEFGLARMAAQSALLGPIMEALFPVFLIATFGELIVSGGEKLLNYETTLRKARTESDNLAISSEKTAESIAIENLKLDDQIEKLQGGPQTNRLAIALADAKDKADALSQSLQGDIEKGIDLFQGTWSSALSEKKVEWGDLIPGIGPYIEEQFKIADIKGKFQGQLNAIEELKVKVAQAPAGSSALMEALRGQEYAYEGLSAAIKKELDETELDDTQKHALTNSYIVALNAVKALKAEQEYQVKAPKAAELQAQDVLPGIRETLSEIQSATGSFREIQTAAEVGFWATILANQKLSASQRLQVEQELNRAKHSAAAQAFQEQIALDREYSRIAGDDVDERVRAATKERDDIVAAETNARQQTIAQIQKDFELKKITKKEEEALTEKVNSVQIQNTKDVIDANARLLEAQMSSAHLEAENVEQSVSKQSQTYAAGSQKRIDLTLAAIAKLKTLEDDLVQNDKSPFEAGKQELTKTPVAPNPQDDSTLRLNLKSREATEIEKVIASLQARLAEDYRSETSVVAQQASQQEHIRIESATRSMESELREIEQTTAEKIKQVDRASQYDLITYNQRTQITQQLIEQERRQTDTAISGAIVRAQAAQEEYEQKISNQKTVEAATIGEMQAEENAQRLILHAHEETESKIEALRQRRQDLDRRLDLQQQSLSDEVRDHEIANAEKVASVFTNAWVNAFDSVQSRQTHAGQLMQKAFLDILSGWERMLLQMVAKHAAALLAILGQEIANEIKIKILHQAGSQTRATGETLLTQILQSLGLKKVAQNTAAEGAQTSGTVAGVAARTAVQKAGDISSGASRAAKLAGEIQVDAAEGGAAAFASVIEALPFPANVIAAPPVAAGVVSAIEGFGAAGQAGNAAGTAVAAAIPGAAGGMRVDRDQLVQVHAGELIVPEILSSPFVTGAQNLPGHIAGNLASAGSIFSAPSSTGSGTRAAAPTSDTNIQNSIHHHYNITVNSGTDKDEMKEMVARELVPMIKDAQRRGRLP